MLEKIPLFLLTTGLSIVTFINAKSFGAIAENVTFSTRLTNVMVSYLEYLEKALWPKGLSVFYPHPGNALAMMERIALWRGVSEHYRYFN